MAPPLSPALDFLRALWALDHAFQSASKRMETTLGVTSPQRLVVRIVGQRPRLSAGEVAEILHLHPSTLTGILKRLERRGLIERRADPRDGRRALLVLTPRGRTVDALRTGTVEAAVRRVLRTQPAKAIRSARDVVLTLARELDALGE